MSSDDFIGLHDVYAALTDEENCQKTSYVLQFLWRDLSSNYDVIGPYFNCSTTLEMDFLHSVVTRTCLAFCRFDFNVSGFICDGASSNLSLLKLLSGYVKEDIDIQNCYFESPFDGRKIFLIICPSHQV